MIAAIEDAISTYMDDSLVSSTNREETVVEDFEVQVEKVEISTNREKQYDFQKYEEADIWKVD